MNFRLAANIPNFAGVALVDILANGVAVLIIVVVLTIAVRNEQEATYAEQVKEVGTVMTREFSTSLVLNELAASQPALLHDYENSDLDQFWDPIFLPIFEFHKGAVRDPYSGTVWSRAELLREPNSLDQFLVNFTSEQRGRVRGDIYDIDMFYLLMSQLKDHGINILHWHFIGAQPGFGSIQQCPADMPASSCVSESGTRSRVGGFMDSLEEFTGDLDERDRNGSASSSGAWDPEISVEETGEGIGSTMLPQGSRIGGEGRRGPNIQDRWGSFPDARRRQSNGRSGTTSTRRSASELSQGQGGISFRIADPRTVDPSSDALMIDFPAGTQQQILIALMMYLDDLQEAYDEEQLVEPLLRQFPFLIQAYMSRDPELTYEQTVVIDDLTALVNPATRSLLGHDEPLFVSAVDQAELDESDIRLIPNRLLFEVDVQDQLASQGQTIPDEGFVRMNINNAPDLWRGLQTTLQRSAILMISPEQQRTAETRWRAVAYINPRLDDFIIGFTYSAIDDEGRLVLDGEVNAIRVASVNVVSHIEPGWFGVRTWQLIAYGVLGVLLALLLLFWRPILRFTR